MSVFADLGWADAGEHLIKASKVARTDQIVQDRQLTQTAAAELMGIDQPKISTMLRGQFRGYSVDAVSCGVGSERGDRSEGVEARGG